MPVMLSTTPRTSLTEPAGLSAPAPTFGRYPPGDDLAVQTARLLDRLDQAPTLAAGLEDCRARNQALAAHNVELMRAERSLRAQLVEAHAYIASLEEQLLEARERLGV